MLSFLYVYSDHSILKCYNLFSGVEFSMRSFFVIISIVEGIIKLNQFEVDDQVLKKNKLKGITEMNFNLDELNNSDNLKDGRPSNELLTYHVTDDKDFYVFRA